MSIFQSCYIFTRSPQITRVLLFIGFSFSTSYFVIQFSSSNDLWFWSTENGTFLFRLKNMFKKTKFWEKQIWSKWQVSQLDHSQPFSPLGIRLRLVSGVPLNSIQMKGEVNCKRSVTWHIGFEMTEKRRNNG